MLSQLKQAIHWEILKSAGEGLAEGSEEGYEAGTVEGLRIAIRAILAERFPCVASNDVWSRIDTVPALEKFLHSILRAKNEAAAAAKIRKAATPRRRSH